MTTSFTYSVLQYKHSIALGEALNIGILFAFPEIQHLELVYGNTHRLKSIYPNFDSSFLNSILKNLDTKLKGRTSDLFVGENLKRGVVEFIHNHILIEDSTSLQFQEPTSVLNVFKTKEEAINEFARLLLPGFKVSKNIPQRRSEDFLIRQYTNFIFSKYPSFENRFNKNPIVTADHLPYKFDLSWQNGSLNLVKAISFDLIDKSTIYSKATSNFGALTALKDIANKGNIKFDLLISPPQHEEFYVPYKDALNLLEKADTNKEIILVDKLEDYSQRTIDYLTSHKS